MEYYETWPDSKTDVSINTWLASRWRWHLVECVAWSAAAKHCHVFTKFRTGHGHWLEHHVILHGNLVHDRFGHPQPSNGIPWSIGNEIVHHARDDGQSDLSKNDTTESIFSSRDMPHIGVQQLNIQTGMKSWICSAILAPSCPESTETKTRRSQDKTKLQGLPLFFLPLLLLWISLLATGQRVSQSRLLKFLLAHCWPKPSGRS